MRRSLLGALCAVAISMGLAPLASAAPAESGPDSPVNLARLETTAVDGSGTEAGTSWTVEKVVDGDDGTDYTTRENLFRDSTASRWSATNGSDNQPPVTLDFDFGAIAEVSSVNVTWGRQFATRYQFQTSTDGSTWTDVGDAVEGLQSETVSTDLNVDTRYLRLKTLAHRSQWPVSIWEVDIQGTIDPDSLPKPLPSIIPMPASLEVVDGDAFTLTADTDIVADAGAQAEAEKLATILRASTGFNLNVVDVSDDDIPDIVFETNEGDAGEAYQLVSSEGGVQISAASEHGLFNGGRTLLQLLGPWSVMKSPVDGPWTVPAVDISDSPRFDYRGVLIDPARSFLTVDEMKQAIDVLSLYKFSYLHIHLVDDQGWRIEITNDGREEGDTIDYTRLTDIAGATAMGPTDRNELPGVTGFYTQDDLRDIVAYAADRHIQVVPEIDMPGHSGGILNAIPQLNTPGSSHDGTVDPDTGETIENPADYIVAPPQDTGDVGNSYLDPDSDTTWTFLRHVVSQVQDITQGDLFHVGGDETHKMHQRYGGEKVANFLKQASAMVHDLGITPIGWNEWAPGGNVPAPGDVMQLWNGNEAGFTNGLKASQGRVIYSQASRAYFPQKAGPGIWGATWACGGACGLDRFYDYDPQGLMGLPAEQMLGVEGAMWSEHARSIQDFFFPSFPRAMAVAEVGWTSQDLRNGKLNDMKRRISDQVPALTILGADFYNGGIETPPQIRAAVNDGTSNIVGYVYSPATPADAVSAKITWDDGTTIEVTANVTRAAGTTSELIAESLRPYKPSNDNNNNNRAQAGLWVLKISEDDLAQHEVGDTGTLSASVTSPDGEAVEVGPVAFALAADADDTEPSETEPSETEASETEPSVTEPTETEPSETEPSVTDPSETDPIEPTDSTEPSESTQPSESENPTDPTVEPTDTTSPTSEPTVEPTAEPSQTDGSGSGGLAKTGVELIPLGVTSLALLALGAALVRRRNKEA